MLTALNASSRWAKLRLLGNSHLAQATILVPFLGYFLIFNAHIFDYLKIHTNFCSGTSCAISWRLYFIYFGCFFVAVGSAIYSLRCPTVVKIYSGASNFFEAEKTYFSAPQNLKYLFKLIEVEKKAPVLDPFDLKKLIANNAAISQQHGQALADILGEYYVLQNTSKPISRALAFISYMVGVLLLLVPTIGTFIQLVGHILRDTIR